MTRTRKSSRGPSQPGRPRPAPTPGEVGRTFASNQLGPLAFPTEFPEVDRRVLIPFQADAQVGWARIIDAAARVLSNGPLHGAGILLAGELPREIEDLAPAPYFRSRPVALFVSGSPDFVTTVAFRFGKALGAAPVVARVPALPALDLLAAVSMTHVVICEEADLGPHAAQLVKGGLNVTQCDAVMFDLGVTATVQSWIDAVAAKPSSDAVQDSADNHERPKSKNPPKGSRAFEPNEPKVGDEIPVPGEGWGFGSVVRVVRYRGQWTRVLVRVAIGCMPVPEFDGQPADKWSVPTSEQWVSREEVERRLAHVGRPGGVR